MKNILILLLLCATTVQAQIINIEDWDGEYTIGAYYKDVNNHLNQFEGTYKYSGNGEEITIVFKKITNYYNSVYYQDILTGEIKYVKNGTVVFNNLSKINTVFPNQFSHDIVGNSILDPGNRPVCIGCTPNQKRANLIFFGRDNNNRGGTIILQKVLQPNQPEKMKIDIIYGTSIWIEGEPEPLDAKIKDCEYVLIKQ